MSSDASTSTTPLNSGLQSFRLIPWVNEIHWKWSAARMGWSFESRLRAMALSVLVTVIGYFAWRRTGGYWGYAIFLGSAATILFIAIRVAGFRTLGRIRRPVQSLRSLYVVIAALGLAVVRLMWQGNPAVAFFSVLLMGMLGIVLHGKSLAIITSATHWIIATVDGFFSWLKLYDLLSLFSAAMRRWSWLAWIIPIGVISLFLVPLLLAHPDVVEWLDRQLSQAANYLFRWIVDWDLLDTAILIGIAAMSLGLLLPSWVVNLELDRRVDEPIRPCNSLTFLIFRNTLIGVIAVFVMFLGYEFSTLWFHEFPENFYYSGYAHQGAAWLTIALAMSTLTLCVMFSKSAHRHPRIKTLQRLAMLWSICNFFMVIAVYYRLSIYVNFNGLTRMRIVGYIGVTCVLAGFILVLYRVYCEKGWVWLIQGQLWACAVSIFALSILPMDWISHAWNVSRIAKGQLAPSVQFAAHDVSDEGLLRLLPLVDSEEPLLRQGIRALLAQRIADPSNLSRWTRRIPEPISHDLGTDEPAPLTWATFQGSTYKLNRQLRSIQDKLRPHLESTGERITDWRAFHQWAMQWY